MPVRQSVRSTLRWAETFFPFVRPMKFRAYNFATRHFGRHMDQDFIALGRLGQAKLALDIGGNWGQSIEALKRCSNPARIISFEPNQHLAHYLAARYADDPAVEIAAHGLSDSAGSMRLHVPRYRNFVYDGLASLNEDEARNFFTPQRMRFFDPAKVSIDSQDVELKTLDSLNLDPDIVKIDVQGAENMVVRGGMATFKRCRPACIIEYPDKELVAMFETLDMRPYYFDGAAFHAYAWQYKNAIFATAEQVARMSGTAKES